MRVCVCVHVQGPGGPQSGGGFSPGQSQVTSQDHEKVGVAHYHSVEMDFQKRFTLLEDNG